MQKINALSCSKPIQFAIDHLSDFSHNELNLLNILSRTLGCQSLFIQERPRNKQRLFRGDLEASKEIGCSWRNCHRTPMVVIFDVVLFNQLFVQLLDFLT